MLLNNAGIYEGIIDAGLRLAEIPEAEGGWKEMFSESEYGDLRIHDDYMRAQSCLVLENAKRWIARRARVQASNNGLIVLDETTRSAMVGGFSDYLFPVIRASFPTNAINDLVSLQATNRRTATVVYWNWIVGGNQAKGAYSPGTRLFDANRGKQDRGFDFTSEYINGERIGTGDGTTGPALNALIYHDGGGVRPGTVRIEATVGGSPAVIADNGNGGWLGGIAGTINYKTGVVAITFGGTVDGATPIIARYRYDSEGSQLASQVDVQITTSTVETERRSIRFNWSMEGEYDVLSEFGVSLKPNLVSGAAEQINSEIAYQLVAEMWSVAPVVSTFAKTGPTEYSRTEHYRDFKITLNEASNRIWARTQKGYGNWIVVDELAANLVESMGADFEAAPRPASVQGLHFIGTLAGKYRVYKDIHLDKLPGASVNGNMLMGYKGADFYQAGMVYSPYHVLYSSPTLTTADMVNQQGMATRYATKMVNPDFYVRINLAS